MEMQLFKLPDNINAKQMGINRLRISLDRKIILSEETGTCNSLPEEITGREKMALAIMQCVFMHYMSGLHGRSERSQETF